jgi:N-acetylmuramoyl-L-alanine amidase
MHKISKQISKMSNEELLDLASKNQSVQAVLEQAFNRNNEKLIYHIFSLNHIVSIPVYIKNLLKIIPSLKNDTVILNKILNFPESVVSNYPQNELNALLNSNPSYAAVALIARGTPYQTILNLISHFKLNDINNSFYFGEEFLNSKDKQQSPILKELISLLKKGHIWENQNSGLLLLSRLQNNNHDPFITEIAKYNLNPSMAEILNDASKQVKTNNNLTNNIKENKSVSFQLINVLEGNFRENLSKVIENQSFFKNLNWSWEIINEKLKVNPYILIDLIELNYDTNKNPFFIFWKLSWSHKEQLLSYLFNLSENTLKDYTEIITKIINEIIYSELEIYIENLDESFLQELTLTPTVREHLKMILQKKNFKDIQYENEQHLQTFKNLNENEFNDHFEDLYFDLENIMAKNKNWYKTAKIYHQSGFTDTLKMIILAMAMVLGGHSIWYASQKTNVPVETIEEYLNNEQAVEKVKNNLTQINELQKEFTEENSENQSIQENTQELSQELSQEDIKNIDIIAQTIYQEARGESFIGKMAVASVIYNRGKGDVNKMIYEIKRPKQFSCWNGYDWNNYKMSDIQSKTWEDSKKIAESIVKNQFSPTINSDHYFNPKKCNPYWAYKDPKTKTQPLPYQNIGNHRFLIP